MQAMTAMSKIACAYLIAVAVLMIVAFPPFDSLKLAISNFGGASLLCSPALLSWMITKRIKSISNHMPLYILIVGHTALTIVTDVWIIVSGDPSPAMLLLALAIVSLGLPFLYLAACCLSRLDGSVR